jgi:hypothetical protein
MVSAPFETILWHLSDGPRWRRPDWISGAAPKLRASVDVGGQKRPPRRSALSLALAVTLSSPGLSLGPAETPLVSAFFTTELGPKRWARQAAAGAGTRSCSRIRFGVTLSTSVAMMQARKDLTPPRRWFGIHRSADARHALPAGEIEPPHDEATTRCLPTWLSPQMMVAEAGIEPAADEAYETPALPTELFRDVATGCPSWVRTKLPSSKPGALPARRRGNAVCLSHVPPSKWQPRTTKIGNE